MSIYIFKTNTTMKPYNYKKWWIDEHTVKEKRITAENVTEALQEYQKRLADEDYITVSDNAIKNKQPMFKDINHNTPQQIGYVLTGKTDFFDENNYKYVNQYIELWIEILQIVNPFEEAIKND